MKATLFKGKCYSIMITFTSCVKGRFFHGFLLCDTAFILGLYISKSKVSTPFERLKRYICINIANML